MNNTIDTLQSDAKIMANRLFDLLPPDGKKRVLDGKHDHIIYDAYIIARKYVDKDN